ncbi:hypothetical protein D9M68_925760 [compost metagenome]
MFLSTFACQVGVGFVLDLWPASSGHYPKAAHLTAWAGLVALQALAAVWYAMGGRRARREAAAAR